MLSQCYLFIFQTKKTKCAHPYLKLDKSHKFLTREWKLSNTLRNRRAPWIINFSIIPSAVKMKQPSNYHKIRLYLYDKVYNFKEYMTTTFYHLTKKILVGMQKCNHPTSNEAKMIPTLQITNMQAIEPAILEMTAP